MTDEDRDFVANLLIPWRPGAVLEIRRKIMQEMAA